MNAARMVGQISRERLAEDLWRLVLIPSPTGSERQIAEAFAKMLAEAGAMVEIDRGLPESPAVIGRIRGSRPGRTIQLAGHLDHIDVPHAPPERTTARVSGRGSADMKNGLACMLEIARVFSSPGADFPGEILFTAYGLHEAPKGGGQGLRRLLDRGIKGDAAIDLEGPSGAVIFGKGQSIWRIELTREGKTCHELRRPAGADGLTAAALAIAGRLLEENSLRAAAPQSFPLIGPESVFIGQIHYGDFYNRSPDACFLEGTMRWNPDKSFADVKESLRRIIAATSLPKGVTARERWTFVGESYAVEPDSPVVGSLRSAWRELRGTELADAGTKAVLDTNLLVPYGKVPAVPIDCDGESAHSDREGVSLEKLEHACRLALLTAIRYLEHAENARA